MQIIRQFSPNCEKATAVAIGNFDGLHLGHQAVLTAMKDAANAQQLLPCVLTFEPHPRRFFAPTTPAFRLERLCTKLSRLREAGVAQLFMPRFNAAFAGLSPEDFLNHVLRHHLSARAVIVGENFAFGRDRGGDIHTLQAWGRTHGIAVTAVSPVRFGEAICSSSAIRAALASGDVVAASHLLGRPYQLSGRVVHGDGRGRSLGFPTANISLPPTLKLPAYGVYAVTAHVGNVTYKAVANLGVKPTVSNQPRAALEVHLLDESLDLYGKHITVNFVEYIRPEQKFEGLKALTAQIGNDCLRATSLLYASTL